MGRKAKRLRLMKKLAARQAAVNPSVGKENSVAIEELKKAVKEAPAPVVEEKAEPIVEKKEEPKKTTTRRRKTPKKNTKSSK